MKLKFVHLMYGLVPFFFLFLVSIHTLAVLPATARQQPASSQLSIEVKVEPPKATVGDIVIYSIIFRHKKNLEPSPPDVTGLEKLEILGIETKKPRTLEGQIEQEYRIRLRALETGNFPVTGIRIPFVTTSKNGEKVSGYAAVPERNIRIESVLRLEGEPTDIRDIKPLVETAWYWIKTVLWVALLISILAFAIWAYINRAARPRAGSSPKARPLLPHEAALREIDALQARKLMELGRVREHYFELSEIFRRYLGVRYDFPAPDWTSEEICAQLPKLSEMDADQRKAVAELLVRTDLVKFAREEVPQGTDETQAVINFIMATKQEPQITEPAVEYETRALGHSYQQ